MWDSYKARSIRWERVFALAALVAGGAFLAGRVIVGPRLQPAPDAAAAAPAAAVQAERAAVLAQLTRAEAGELILRWQQVKAEALGPRHAVRRLGSVLSGELLQQWQARVEAVRERGWHYLHALESSKVEGVSVDAEAGTATVRAVLSESVEAHRGDDKGQPQTFHSEYAVDYKLLQQGGAWTIVGAEVQQ